MNTGQRSPVTYHDAPRKGFGTSRRWTRTIGGKLYSFTAVLMPNGERRYAADVLFGNDRRFSCNWKPVAFWTRNGAKP